MSTLDYETLKIIIMISTPLIVLIFVLITDMISRKSKDIQSIVAIVLLVVAVFLYGVFFLLIRNDIAQQKANELAKLNTAPKEYKMVLNGIKADNITYLEDYLQNTDHVTVYVDDNRKIVRIITGQ